MSVPSGDRIVSVSRLVRARPDQIFEILADPRMHWRSDGSGTVRADVRGPGRLHLGARFSMAMRWGLPYRTSNTVIEFEEGRRIAWWHFAHNAWRYVLEPRDGGTLVTEQFDWTRSRSSLLLRRTDLLRRNEAAMRATLDRIAGLLEV
ncbi:MAG: SRPBCC family protein [Ilumatobacteraceae bacterium]